MTTTLAEPRNDRVPNSALSLAFGAGAGLLVGFVGPLYGGLIVIMSFALVFRSARRVDLRSLFAGFTPVWLLLALVGTNITTSVEPGNEGLLVIVGFVPLALSGMTVLLSRRRGGWL